jgi:pilus assembly protein CpaE
MAQKLRIVVAGRSAEALAPLAEGLAKVAGVACSTNVINGAQPSLLASLHPMPDVLLLHFDAGNLSDLAALADSGRDGRPALIVVGPAGNADAIRLAMRSGARDFLPEPVRPEELAAALDGLRDATHRGSAGSSRGDLTVVVGAAGGVGTSLIACNLALACTMESKVPTLLMDLDINAAPLASFLDLAPERGIPAALAEVEFLDEHALPGYVTKHESGLRLMGAPATSLVPYKNIDVTRVGVLMDLLTGSFGHVVADASHMLDELSVAVLGRATTVVLVMQQSVVQLKKTARMLRILTREIGVLDDHILVVVNRRIKHSTVALEDIRRTLRRERLPVVPNDYKSALASIDSGVPLLKFDPSSLVSKAIVELQRQIAGELQVERPSFLRRALPFLSGE